MNPVEILIADDHDLTRRSLRRLIESDDSLRVCGEASDGVDAVEKAKQLRPQVVLMDLSMPRMDGSEATRLIRKDNPESQVIIVSQNDPRVLERLAAQCGARAFISKSNLAAELLPAIQETLSSKRPETPPSSTPADRNTAGEEWLFGGGTLALLIRQHDWTQTPLGALETWPQSLRTAANLMLNSQHPMWIGWGPEKTFLYNDAYISVLSPAKHPWALGRPASEVWSEIWEFCGPLAEKVFTKGQPSFVDDVRLFMNRGEFLEETYYSFSYSPIYDESGAVAGLFCPSTEITPKVLHARRLHTLSELSAKSLTARSTLSACQSCIETISQNPDDIPFALLYLLDEDQKTATLQGVAHLPENSPVSPLNIHLASDSAETFWPIREVVASSALRTVSLATVDALPRGPAEQRIRSAIVLPVISPGLHHPVAVLVAAINPTRILDADYRTFYTLIADQVAAALQNARTAQQEKERADALAEIDRAKTVFFSNVSHEFRTPLTLMLGPLEELLARSYTDLSPATKGQLEMVNRNGIRLLRLVNTLLDFSRIEAGRMQAVYQPTDLAVFTAELASVFRSAIERAGLSLIIHCKPLTEPVYVDRDMWEKIVLNLISNAFKFTFEGEITVELSAEQGSAVLRVKDTGVGIPAEEMPRLFERFHRIAHSRSRTHEGSGIGLALVHELVKLHSGTLTAESTLGDGTVFVVRIPLGSHHLPAGQIGSHRTAASTAIGANAFVEEAIRWLPDADIAEEELPARDDLLPVPAPASATASNRTRVLVADDNADMRRYLVRLLTERYDVDATPDGQAALEAARAHKPNLILSDIMMPRLDGLGLLYQLRADPDLREIPIILLSARAGEESRLEGVQAGADDYLIKPFSARELIARVEAHVKMQRMREQARLRQQQLTLEYERLLNQAPIGIYLVDSEFKIRHVNPIALPVFNEIPDLVGRDFDETIRKLWVKDYADEVVRIFRNTLDTGESFATSERAERRIDLGVVEFYEWRVDRIALPEGGFGVVCYFRDISDRVLAERALQNSEDRYRRLAETLEEQVHARTLELERRNQENVFQSQALRQLSTRLLQVQDEERRRIARELHDSAGQTLTILALSIAQFAAKAAGQTPELAPEAETLQDTVQQLHREIRTASYLLHPPLLDESGLSSALNWYAQGLNERSGIEIALDIPADFGRLPRELELVIFRIVQECLTNIHRHSGSKTASIKVQRDSSQIIIEVKDQGKGIAPERLAQIQSGASGVGIRGMQERLRQFDGALNLSSDPSGTRTTVTIPISTVATSPTTDEVSIQT